MDDICKSARNQLRNQLRSQQQSQPHRQLVNGERSKWDGTGSLQFSSNWISWRGSSFSASEKSIDKFLVNNLRRVCTFAFGISRTASYITSCSASPPLNWSSG